MQVRWFEQSQAEVPAHQRWLSAWETLHVERLRIPKRRSDWLLGRWTAKRALAESLGWISVPETLSRIEVWPALSGAPQPFVDGSPPSLSMSLSHAGGRAACAVGPVDVAVGCDLEVVEPRSDAFVADYFTGEEQAALREISDDQRTERITAIWSAKESALKAMQVGLRVDTRSLAIVFNGQCETPQNGIQVTMPYSRDDTDWHVFSVRREDSPFRYGCWFSLGTLVRTLVCLPAGACKS
jgi:4'-phosphopantetheinyl transferase